MRYTYPMHQCLPWLYALPTATSILCLGITSATPNSTNFGTFQGRVQNFNFNYYFFF